MRILALLLAVGLIVTGGFWLARERANDQSTPAAAGASEAGSQQQVDTETQAPSQEGEDGDAGATPAGDAGSAMGEGDAAPEAPDGDAAAGAADGAADGDRSGSADDAESQGDTSEGSEPAPGSLLPEGFDPVPYRVDEPRRAFDAPEDVIEDGFDYVAVLRTNRGDIVVDLYEDRTPETVDNFVFLALNRYYQGVPFHRVLEDFMAQTGDPTGTGSGGPGYQFEDEIVEDLSFDRAGLLAMANAGPGTNGSQFFITFTATPWLDGGHTIFGHVLEGEELLAEIARVDPANPSAVVTPDETLDALAEQGIDLPGDGDQSVESAIDELVGTAPVAGQSFTVAGYRGVLGQMGENPAYGFFNQPDTLLNVVIGRRPAS